MEWGGDGMAKEEDLSGAPTDSASARKYVFSLEDSVSKDAHTVGAKAANLATLLQAGFPVPPGIAVTTQAFTRYKPSNLAEEDGIALRHELLTCKFDPEFKEELRQALLPYRNQPVAVRSSGVAEDLEGASFAGQYDTFLGVQGQEDIEDAIRKCWASAFSEHILQYRTAKLVISGRMAVLIQPLIQADAAGVAFTVNPVTGDRGEAVVSSVRGLGERLVSGQASPDEWRVRGNQVVADSMPEKAICPDQVLEVAKLARKAEEYFGEPQDVEWAIQGDKLYLLQARPITTLSKDQRKTPAMIPFPIHPPEGYWEREDSHFPDLVSPATRSAFIPLVNRAFRRMCSEMSTLIEALELREIGGWMYQRTVPLGGKDRKAPPAWLMPLLIRIVPQLKSRIKGSVQAVREDKAGRFIDQWYSEWKPSLIRSKSRLSNVNVAAIPDDQLIRHLKEIQELMRDGMEKHMYLNGAIQLILAEYAFACRDVLGWDEAKMLLLFSGLSEMSSAPSRSLAELAHDARRDPGLAEAIQGGAKLSDLRMTYAEFAKKLTDYIDEYGCRAIRNELTFPTVAESPELILRLVKDQLKRNYNPDDDRHALEGVRSGQLAEANAILKNKANADKTRFYQALSRAEKAYPVREEHGFYDRDAPLALFRYALLEAGRRLADRNQLDCADDVFFLEIEELFPALESRAAVREIVERRKAERNWTLAHPGPASYGVVPPPPPSFDALPKEARFAANGVLWALEQVFAAQQSGRKQDNSGRIRGIAASKGRYTGKVRVIRDESEFDRIQPGEVLVCPITSPVWSMLFPSIGALITDSGGMLSHSAIIAREYRIPAIVATGNATELLQDGQIVIVDGDKGIVELNQIR
jgi:rifampicin phosphotransferase